MTIMQTTLQTLILPCFVILLSTPVQSQITPDTSLGEEASTLTPNTAIDAKNVDVINGGAIRGINLFHSFEQFNIQNGQSVYFANPSGVDNILTRVTGGNASNILGTLGVNGSANLFLLNPNGIIFGENARLDLGGSFVGTTANMIQFGDEGFFDATNPESPPLLTVNPSALLFNQINQNATIQNNSVAPVGQNLSGENVFGLRVPNGKSLLLVGGNISMDGGRLNAFDGRVELGGLAQPGSVNIDWEGDNLLLGFSENIIRSSVSLTNQAKILVEGAGRKVNPGLIEQGLIYLTRDRTGGDITINAGNLEISGGSQLSAGIGEGLGTSENEGGDITLNTTGKIQVSGSGTGIRNLVRQDSTGNGGQISIDAGSFKLLDAAQIVASTFGKGNAGSVTVRAKDNVELADRAYIFSTVESRGTGNGGDIKVNAARLSLQNGAQLLTTIRATPDIIVSNNRRAGNVDLQVSGTVEIAGENEIFPSSIRSDVENGAFGLGGDIRIDAGSVYLKDGALLTTANFGQTGIAGKIEVIAKDTVSLTGAGIFSSAEVGNVGTGGGIFVFLPETTPGDISITSPKILLDDSGILNTDSANGSGGNIKLTSDLLLLSRASKITSNASVSKQGGGNGGNIDINSRFIVALPQQDNDINANAFQGKGGNVSIKTERIFGIQQQRTSLPGENEITASSNVGLDGEVTINQPDVDLTQGIIELPAQVVDRSDQVGQICPRTPEAARNISEFTVTGSGSLPPSPLEPLVGSEQIPDLAVLNGNNIWTGANRTDRTDRTDAQNRWSQDHSYRASHQIIEAQGWVKTPDGKIHLVAQAPQVKGLKLKPTNISNCRR